MTDLRTAAQQALEAWDQPHGINYIDFRPYMDTLRAALSEPVQEPVALESVYETIIQWDEGGGKRSRRELARRIVDLHTAPPQRKPLTEEEIHDCWQQRHRDKTTERRLITRAIERAHGIAE